MHDLKQKGTSVNTADQKDDQPKKSVHLRIEDINFTDSSLNKDVNSSKTTADVTTDGNTDIDMMASGGNFVARNPERSATGIDFQQYNGEKEIHGGINILSNKIENAGAKEPSDIDIPPDMNDMDYLDDDKMDEDEYEKENDSNEEMWQKPDDGKNVSDKSKPDDVPEGNGEKSSEELVNKDNVSDTNAVDGEIGRSKNSEPVVVIKYGCQKCTKICYTESGYHTHLFRAHRIRNVKNYPPQKIEGTTVDSANVFVDQYGSKEEPKYPCDECGQLFFHESSIATHKMHAHTASADDDGNDDGVENKSEVNEDTKIDEDEEKIEKGRQILKTTICKPGSKKKPKISQRKPRSPRKQSKGIKNTQVRRSARIANSSQETIENETILNSDENKSASKIDKTLPDIIPPRRITRSTRIESKDESKAENVTSPSMEKSQSRSVTTGSKTKRRSQLSENSAQDDDLNDQLSPASVLQKISRIVTRSQTAEQDVSNKEQLNVTIHTKFDKKPKNIITRSKKVETTGDLSQPSLMDNEPRRMRMRSQSSEKSENSVQNRKNEDNSHDATLDVTVSLLNMNIDGSQKKIISPMSKTDDKKPENATNRKLPKRKRSHSNDDSIDDKAHDQKHKKTNTEDNETTENDTYENNLDDVQLVNSDKDVSGVTSESSAARPTQSRMTTRSSTNNERGRRGKISTPIKQTEEQITDSHEDNDESALTSENSAAEYQVE